MGAWMLVSWDGLPGQEGATTVYGSARGFRHGEIRNRLGPRSHLACLPA